MVPEGCVHLRLNGLLAISRQLEIDCVPAVVGWEFHKGGNHPMLVLNGCKLHSLVWLIFFLSNLNLIKVWFLQSWRLHRFETTRRGITWSVERISQQKRNCCWEGKIIRFAYLVQKIFFLFKYDWLVSETKRKSFKELEAFGERVVNNEESSSEISSRRSSKCGSVLLISCSKFNFWFTLDISSFCSFGY